MENHSTNIVPLVSRAGRLADALQRVRAREQSRARDALAARDGRLQALAHELRALADELPAGEGDRFSLVASHMGDRLSVDSLSYVDLHPQTLDYRLVRHRRDGPETVLQSADRDAMADGVADYIAERIVEREGLIDPNGSPVAGSSLAAEPVRPVMRFWPGFWLFVLGGLCTATALFVYAWLRVGAAG